MTLCKGKLPSINVTAAAYQGGVDPAVVYVRLGSGLQTAHQAAVKDNYSMLFLHGARTLPTAVSVRLAHFTRTSYFKVLICISLALLKHSCS